MANLYSENALLVTVDGQRMQGRTQIRRGIQQQMSQAPMRNTSAQIEITGAQLYGNDLALVEFRQTLTPRPAQASSGTGTGMEGTGTGGSGTAGQSQQPMTLEGVSLAQRNGNRWQILTTHVFPSRELLRQQMGTGGSGMQPEHRAPKR